MNSSIEALQASALVVYQAKWTIMSILLFNSTKKYLDTREKGFWDKETFKLTRI